MKTYNELTPEQQGAARNKCLNWVLETAVEAPQLITSGDDDPLMVKINAAAEKAEAMRTPWFTHEYIMDTCREELEDMARARAESALYSGPSEDVIGGVV